MGGMPFSHPANSIKALKY